MTRHEIAEGDYVYGWWAVLADDGSALLICLIRRQRWNFLFHLDSHDEQDPPGPHSWVMQPDEHDSLNSMHLRIESAIDAIFAEQRSRRQVFVEVCGYGRDAAYSALRTLHALGFPTQLVERAV